MKPLRLAAACALLTLNAAASNAQFVKGNEAVTPSAGGGRRVELPTQPSSRLPKPCPADRAGCAGGGWKMVETAEGLRECTELYARPGTCRVSTYGMEKRSRLWIVKSKETWLACQYPDLSSKCVRTGELPYSAVQ